MIPFYDIQIDCLSFIYGGNKIIIGKGNYIEINTIRSQSQVF